MKGLELAQSSQRLRLIRLGLTIGVATLLLGLLLYGLREATAAPADPGIRYVAPSGDCDGATPCYASIQAAVNAANGGDEIRVASGIYTGVQNIAALNSANFTATQLVAIAKSVTLRGGYSTSDWNTSDPEGNPTILDAEGLGRVIVISGAVAPVVEAFHITGGNATGLGGDIPAPPTWPYYEGRTSGGGIYVAFANATIRNCAVYSNVANTSASSSGGGGGVMLVSSNAILLDNTIQNNVASSASGTKGVGGGVYMVASAATLRGNRILHNIASLGGSSGLGGGVYVTERSPAMLAANLIQGNVAATAANSATGGGVLVMNLSAATLDSNTVISNTATQNPLPWYAYGGGIAVQWCYAFTLTNNVIADNHAGNYGSGVYIYGMQGVPLAGALLNNTIAANRGAGDAVYVLGGVYLIGDRDAGRVTLVNTLIASQTVGIHVRTGNDITVTVKADHTLWDGNGIYTFTTGTGHGYLHTINDLTGNPAFVGGGDYHLTSNSAAIDAGTEAGITIDIDGDLRPIGAGYDIGADEFPVVAEVTPSVGGTLSYTGTQSNITTVSIPPGAVTDTTTIVFTPKPFPIKSNPAFSFAGHAFTLEAYRNGTHLPGFAFEKPVTVTIHYSDADVMALDESTLELLYWDGSAWVSDGIAVAERDAANNRLVVTITHLSEFAMFGQSHKVFLPLVLRS